MFTQTQLQLRRCRIPFACFVAVVATCLAGGQSCAPHTFEGEVQRGQSWQHALSPKLDLKLEAVPAGWMIRVLPHGEPRPVHDAAELANPPYRSPTPILISTDFAFRSQDAIAWNPRTFRFFTTPAETAKAESIYEATLRAPDRPAAGADLYPLLQHAPEAKFAIVDAEISGGTANQTAAAATVASHLEQTAHVVRSDVPSTPLGMLLRLRFRITVPSLDGHCTH